MSLTTVVIDLKVGPFIPSEPTYVRWTPFERFTTGNTVVLDVGQPIRLIGGEGIVSLPPGVWVVDELTMNYVRTRAVLVPASTAPVLYTDLDEVQDPAVYGVGPTWAARAELAGEAAEHSARLAQQIADSINPGVPGGLARLNADGYPVTVGGERTITSLEAESLYGPEALANPLTPLGAALRKAVGDQVAEEAGDPFTAIGTVITERTQGAAPVAMSKSGPSGIGASPRLVAEPDPIFDIESSVLPNFYSPQYQSLVGIPRADGTPYEKAGFFSASSNHMGGTVAGCSIRYHDEGDPRTAEVWDDHDFKTFDITNAGTNAEVCRYYYSEARAARGLRPWLAYVSISQPLGASAQHIRIFSAWNIDDPASDWQPERRIYLPAKMKGRTPGSGATGYPSILKQGQTFRMYSTLGNTDSGHSGLFHSDDGISFLSDPRPLGRESRFHSVAGGTLESSGVGIGSVVFISRGRIMAMSRRGRPASGTTTVPSGRVVGFLSEDGRSYMARPSEVEIVTADWVGDDNVAPQTITEFGGDLLAPITTALFAGFARLEGVG